MNNDFQKQNPTPDINQNKENTELVSKKQFFKEIIEFILIAVIIVVPFRLYIAQPYMVSGESMYPTFKNSDYLIIDEISYRFNEPQRGDVLIFKYPNDTTKKYIKRIIGLPGETVNISNDSITIINKENPNGLKLDESYIDRFSYNPEKVELKENEYFVMGDNRSKSSDSRFWGPVNRDLIIGRPVARLFPFNSINIFPGKIDFASSTNK